MLTEVANAIDRELAVDPHKRGIALPNEPGVRILRLTEFEANVSVVFECIPDDRIVRVIRVQFRAE